MTETNIAVPICEKTLIAKSKLELIVDGKYLDNITPVIIATISTDAKSSERSKVFIFPISKPIRRIANRIDMGFISFSIYCIFCF